MASTLRLWFSFSEPVDRGTYFRHGVGLMVFKYGVDAGLIWLFAHRFWTPIDYLSPALAVRAAKLAVAPNWLLLFLMAWTLPFLWIGVSMSMRRALDAGRSVARRGSGESSPSARCDRRRASTARRQLAVSSCP